MTGARTVDVAHLLDERPIAPLQVRVFVLCAFVALLDGVCSQGIGVAGPLIAADLGMPMGAFAPAFSAGLFGATIGAVTFGPLADRFGRKPILIFATALFGVFTVLTAFAESFSVLVAYRFVAGLGLGGATPCFITMSAEYAPAKRRAMFVSLLWAGFPAGNAVGGFMTSYIVSNFSWQAVFYAGGVPALILAALLVPMMPESLRFMASQGAKGMKAARLVRALDPGQAEGAIALTGGSPVQTKSKVPVRDLFTEGRAAGTLLLWAILFLAFATTTVIVLQTPTLLRQNGIPLSTTGILVGVFSICSTTGMAFAGKLVEKFGPAVALAPAFGFGAVMLSSLGYFGSDAIVAGIVMALLGLSVPLGASGAISLTAMFYPTAMRGAGVGWAMGLGRFGQVCSPLVVGAFLTAGWPPARILAVMAAAPLLAAFSVLLRSLLVRSNAPVPDRRIAGEAKA